MSGDYSWHSCGDAERREKIANCKTNRKFAKTMPTAALMLHPDHYFELTKQQKKKKDILSELCGQKG